MTGRNNTIKGQISKLEQVLENFFLKIWIVDIFGSVGHEVCVTTSQPCPQVLTAATDNDM